MAEILTLGKSKSTFVNESGLTDGKYLRKKFMDKMDPDKLLTYKKKATEILDELVEKLNENIEADKPPIAQKDSMQSSTGIIAPNNELEELFSDFTFSTILGDLAEERDLKIDIQARPVGVNTQTKQPVIGVVLVCTFK